MNEKRADIRYETLAKAKIEGISEGDILLKDISITGCHVECTTYLEIKPNIQYNLEVMPESAANIDTFTLLVEIKWIRSESYCCEIGFLITEFPKRKLFQRYVDYLDWHKNKRSNRASEIAQVSAAEAPNTAPPEA